jgi:hypothetical protein
MLSASRHPVTISLAADALERSSSLPCPCRWMRALSRRAALTAFSTSSLFGRAGRRAGSTSCSSLCPDAMPVCVCVCVRVVCSMLRRCAVSVSLDVAPMVRRCAVSMPLSNHAEGPEKNQLRVSASRPPFITTTNNLPRSRSLNLGFTTDSLYFLSTPLAFVTFHYSIVTLFMRTPFLPSAVFAAHLCGTPARPWHLFCSPAGRSWSC